MAPSRDGQTRIDIYVPDDLAGQVRTMAEAAGASQSEVVRAGLRHYTRQRPVYDFTGATHSFVRDAWSTFHPNETTSDPVEAERRLTAFRNWQREVREDWALFATTTTTTAAAVVPPAYQPLLSSYTQDRPLFAAATRAAIGNATAFTLPGVITDSGVDSAVGSQTEGTNRADNASPAFTAVTVSPTGVVGLFRCTREIIDSSNPAIDSVALSVMRESYGRQTEARIFTELNSTQSGVITGLQVPNGAMARTSAGTALPADLRKAILDFGGIRGMRPRRAVASMRQSVAEALDGLDASTVPEGSEAFFVTHGCGVYLSPQISGTAAGDGDAFVLGAGDLWAWSSPLVEFTYNERQGPAMVDLSLFGYFAARVINPRGVSSIRHT